MGRLRAVPRLRPRQVRTVPRHGLQTVIRRCCHPQQGSLAPARSDAQERQVAPSHRRPQNVPSVPRHPALSSQLPPVQVGTPWWAKALAATQEFMFRCKSRRFLIISRAALKLARLQRRPPQCLWHSCRVLCRLPPTRQSRGELWVRSCSRQMGLCECRCGHAAAPNYGSDAS